MVLESESLSWSASTATLPTPSAKVVVGYDDEADKIWMLGLLSLLLSPIDCTYHSMFKGGYDYQNGLSNNRLEYDVHSGVFTVHLPLPIEIGSSHSETTMNGTIFMVAGTDFAAFDMRSNTFMYPWNDVSIPSTVDGIEYGEGCLTNLNGRYLILLGGQSADSLSYSEQMLIYDVWSGWWLDPESTKKMVFGRSRFSCAVHNDFLFVMGGEVRGSQSMYTSSLQKLFIADIENTAKYDWINLVDLSQSKAFTRSVIVGDFIYVLGGYGWESRPWDPWSVRATVERIDTIFNIIRIEGELEDAVASPGAVYVPSTERIFVIGGIQCDDDDTGQCDVVDTVQLSSVLYVFSLFILIFFFLCDFLWFSLYPHSTNNNKTNSTTEPTTTPTLEPTAQPTSPTLEPTLNPSEETSEPTVHPTMDPTADPTAPSAAPTVAPSVSPLSVLCARMSPQSQ